MSATFPSDSSAPAHLWETEESLGNVADNYVGELNWVAERIGGADTPEVREGVSNDHAVLGTFKKGHGEVFTVGCTDWAYGLSDKNVSRVTKNVLNRFAGLDEKASRADKL